MDTMILWNNCCVSNHNKLIDFHANNNRSSNELGECAEKAISRRRNRSTTINKSNCIRIKLRNNTSITMMIAVAVSFLSMTLQNVDLHSKQFLPTASFSETFVVEAFLLPSSSRRHQSFFQRRRPHSVNHDSHPALALNFVEGFPAAWPHTLFSQQKHLQQWQRQKRGKQKQKQQLLYLLGANVGSDPSASDAFLHQNHHRNIAQSLDTAEGIIRDSLKQNNLQKMGLLRTPESFRYLSSSSSSRQLFIHHNYHSLSTSMCRFGLRSMYSQYPYTYHLCMASSSETSVEMSESHSPPLPSETALPTSSSDDDNYSTSHNKSTSSSAALAEAATANLKPDIPMRTDAGGFTHTIASKAKISAANKGKVPWNKGKSRSEETKARIAEGVRKKNRERFLQKLDDMGLTEEQYELQKKEERRKKDAERRARRTANGGYRPTEETKAKISKVLKEKFARGEIKKRSYAGPFRKGFTHSEETKEKIRVALRKKWAEDPEYQAKMRKSTTIRSNSREKIARTLKQKWQEPEFRAMMIEKMKNRKKNNPSSNLNDDQRKKISLAMKKKWQDIEYRQKALKGMEKYRESLPPKPKQQKKVSRPKEGNGAGTDDGIMAVRPVTAKKRKKKVKKKKIVTGKKKKSVGVAAVSGASPGRMKKTKKRKKKSSSSEVKTNNANASEEVKDDGDISRLREERRDLYDLLYGDESEEILPTNGKGANGIGTNGALSAAGLNSTERNYSGDDDDHRSLTVSPSFANSFFGAGETLDDDNLDNFDPYGLEDF